MPHDPIRSILTHFRFRGEFVSFRELNSGNIHRTFYLLFRDGAREYGYTLQRFNTYVFPDPLGVMRNISQVTQHLKKNILLHEKRADRQVLELVQTVSGEVMHTDEAGGVWRAYEYITDAVALDRVDSLEQMEEVGRAFGRFQRYLADFPAESLFESIPDFHHTAKRFDAFLRAKEEDRAGRAGQVREEIGFFLERRDVMGEIVRLLEKKELPLRVTHNDTKSNNVLLDVKTGKALCVIDLDTVMPGSSLYDYGDGVRFAASTAREDEEDVSLISLDMQKAGAFTRGFVSETAGILSEGELLRLPLGIKVMTCELAMRFLTDYLNGDLYFKISSPEHNLIRARAQIALLKDVERKEEALSDMAARDAARYA